MADRRASRAAKSRLIRGVGGMTPSAWKGALAPRRIDLNGAPSGPMAGRLAAAIDRNVFVVLVLAVVGVLRVSFLAGGIGPDTWYTLVGGRVISRSGLPHSDTLTVLTHGREWVDEQWLAHL